MRLFIAGFTIVLISSMVAFILSFQACNSVTRSIDTRTYDVIDIDESSRDIISETCAK